MTTATKAQVEALRYLVETGQTEGIHSSALAGLYERRSRGQYRPTAMRVVAWKRTSGSNMAAMKRAGLLVWDGWDSYTPRYRFTDAGREAAREEKSLA